MVKPQFKHFKHFQLCPSFISFVSMSDAWVECGLVLVLLCFVRLKYEFCVYWKEDSVASIWSYWGWWNNTKGLNFPGILWRNCGPVDSSSYCFSLVVLIFNQRSLFQLLEFQQKLHTTWWYSTRISIFVWFYLCSYF